MIGWVKCRVGRHDWKYDLGDTIGYRTCRRCGRMERLYWNDICRRWTYACEVYPVDPPEDAVPKRKS